MKRKVSPSGILGKVYKVIDQATNDLGEALFILEDSEDEKARKVKESIGRAQLRLIDLLV